MSDISISYNSHFTIKLLSNYQSINFHNCLNTDILILYLLCLNVSYNVI